VKRLIFKTGARRSDAISHAQARRDRHRRIPSAARSPRGSGDTSGLTLKATGGAFTQGIIFPDQWDPSRRGRIGASAWLPTYAIDRRSLNDAEYWASRRSPPAHSSGFEFAWTPPLYSYDPQKPKQLLTEAGYPSGFNARSDPHRHRVHVDTPRQWPITCRPSGFTSREPHGAGGFQQGAPGKEAQEPRPRATRRAVTPDADRAGVFSEGLYAYGGYPDIDGLFRRGQAAEMDRQEARGESCTRPAAHARACDVRAALRSSALRPAPSPSPASGSISRTPSQLRTRTRSSRPMMATPAPLAVEDSRPTSSPARSHPGFSPEVSSSSPLSARCLRGRR